MASTKKATNSTFKERWDEDLKWRFFVGILTIPSGIVAIALGITTINLFTNWF